MKVKELIKVLQEMPQDFPVYVDDGDDLEEADAWQSILSDPLGDELDCVVIGPGDSKTA